jgi:hypothetical protein
MFYDHADDSVSLMAPRIIRTSAGGDDGPGDPKRARKDEQPLHPRMPVLPGECDISDNITLKQQAEMEILKMEFLLSKIQEGMATWEFPAAALHKINLEGYLNIDTVGMNDAFVRPVVSALEAILGILRILSELNDLKYDGEHGSMKMKLARTVMELTVKSREGWRDLLVFLTKMRDAATRFTTTRIPFNKIGDVVSENEIMYTVFESDYIGLIESLRVFTQTAAKPVITIGAYHTVQLLRDLFVSVQTKTNDFVEPAAKISVLEKAFNIAKKKVSDVAGIDTVRLAIDTYKYPHQTGVEWEQKVVEALIGPKKTTSKDQVNKFIKFANALDGKGTARRNGKAIFQTLKQHDITVE